jgi:hypothetical protein
MASSSNAENPPHLDRYAFSVFGWAIDLGEQPRTLHQRITTFPVSSRTYKMEIESPEEKKLSTSRALMKATEQDIADANPGRTAGCLLVGVPLYGKDSLEIYGKAPKGIKLRSLPIGTSLNDHQLVPMDGLRVLRVVVQITPDAPLALKFYALLEDKDGFAMPFTISHDEVYYFSEFRDWAYNVRGRRAQWNAKIRLYSVENTSVSSSTSSSASSSADSSKLGV